ncbi:hypothetical protein IC582_027358 [Cucumis melo]|uniref:Uncharacterized protein LOC103498923 n=1 Tax=Cucumis melo TaxID=3656 RepID=A0A1S3CCM7_CUCME|nr:uncharacterized protein LOC103498923 [Cucumis melo]
MLLKSSSTPLLGSLLPPDHHHHHNDLVGKHSPSTFPFHCNNKPLSFSTTTASLNSSPSFSDHHRAPAPSGFRRTNSEGNLNTISHASNVIDVHEDPFSSDSVNFKSSNKFSRGLKRSVLQTIPSFSFYGSRVRTEEDEEEEEDREIDTEEEEDDLGNFGINAAVITPEVRAMEQAWSRVGAGGDGIGFVGDLRKEMYLARGLGIGGGPGDGGGGGRLHTGGGGGGGGEEYGMEEYYKKMVVENPGNALVLSNYAEFLYKRKGDLRRAEEYYSRAILMDSQDGEILSKYAKLVWELHHDQQKAISYFQRALQASPHDSHVQAAYANFLWETEENEDEQSIGKETATKTYTAAATA